MQNHHKHLSPLSPNWLLAILIFLAPGASLLASESTAQTSNVASTPSPVDLLKKSQYAELDKFLMNLQHAYENDSQQVEPIRSAFWLFWNGNPELHSNFDEWVEKYPRSYAAHLARGVYFISLGGEARGDKYIDETPPDNVAQMKQYFAKAMPDLEKSLSLSPKPLLSYYGMITIGKHFDWKARNRRWLDAANKIDPTNIIVNERFLMTLRPQWGGSLDDMIAFVKESKNMPLSDAHKKRLESHIWRARARASRIDKDLRSAAEYYSNAINLYDQDANAYVNRGWVYGKLEEHDKALSDYSRAIALEPRYVTPYISRGIIFRSQAKYEKALADLTIAVELDPKSKLAWTNRGSTYQRQKRFTEAMADYKKAAGLGDAWAQHQVGSYYWFGKGIDQDREKAIVWWTEAARNGNADALRDLREQGRIP